VKWSGSTGRTLSSMDSASWYSVNTKDTYSINDYWGNASEGNNWGYVQGSDQRDDPNGLKIFQRTRGQNVGPNKCSGRPGAA
jgi:hypothetical protein